MAILKILKYGDPVLRQKSKEVSKISKKIRTLIENMLDTMYAANGVGLAAPQVGENLRIFVIDVSAENEPYRPLVFVNPKIIKKEGAICVKEGCLSFPEAYTNVRRYSDVRVKALDINGKPFVMDAKDGELLAYAIQHENDHLDGILFIDHSRNIFETTEILKKYNLPQIENEKLINEEELEQIILQKEKEGKETLQDGKEENDDN